MQCTINMQQCSEYHQLNHVFSRHIFLAIKYYTHTYRRVLQRSHYDISQQRQRQTGKKSGDVQQAHKIAKPKQNQ